MSDLENVQDGQDGQKRRRLQFFWPPFYLVLIFGILCYVVLALLPHFKSPQSRVYSSSLGYPSLMRLLGKPIEVEVDKAQRRQMVKTVSGEGQLAYLNEVPVRSEISGIVTEIGAEPGQEVKKGDVLIRLNTGEHGTRRDELTLALARSELDQAKVSLEREKELFKTHATTQVKLELASLNVKHAEIALALAEETYKNSLLSRSQLVVEGASAVERNPRTHEIDILATLSGTVFQRNVQPGENLEPIQTQKDLMLVGDRLVFHAAFDQRYASSVKIRDKGTFYLRAYPGAPFQGEVVRVDNQVNSSARTAQIESAFPFTFSVWLAISFEDLRGKNLIRGMNGYCIFETPYSTLAVPEGAVMRYSGRTGTVLTVDSSDHLQVKNIVYSGTDEAWVAIESGLTEGERVVVQGQTALKAGDRVFVHEG